MSRAASMPLIAVIVAVLLSGAVVAASRPDDVSVTGHLCRWAIDERGPSGQWVSRLVTILTDERGQTYRLEDPSSLLPRDDLGRWIISGPQVGEKLVVRECRRAAVTAPGLFQTPASPVATPSGAQKTLAALLFYANKPKPTLTLDQVREVILSQEESTDAFLRENSYGQLWLTPDFIDWTALPGVSSDYAAGDDTFQRLVIGAFRALQWKVSLQSYSRLILVVSHDDTVGICGVGSIGAVQIWTETGAHFSFSAAFVDEDCLEPGVVAHEFGHNLGFWHSASISCLPENLLDPCYSCSDDWVEYGDEGDAMGASWDLHHFSALWKRRAGWITDTQVQDVFQSGEYWLPQVQLASPGPKVLRIPLGQDLGDFCYWLEYRGAGIFDHQDVIQVRTHSGESGFANQASFYDGYAFSPDSLRFRGLAAAGSISGRVLLPIGGLPAAGVDIVLLDAAWTAVKFARTDESGHYSFDHLPDGYYYLLALDSGLGYISCYYPRASQSSGAQPVDVANGAAVSGIDFELMSGGMISGRVTLLPYGRPAGWTLVTATGEHEGSGTGLTDADGYYSIRSLPEGTYYIKTSNAADGIDQYFPSGQDASDAQLVSVSQGAETGGIDLKLPPGGVVSGRVTSSVGAPIEYALVYILQKPGFSMKSGWSDSSGNYRIAGVPPGQYLVSVEKSDYIRSYYPDSTTVIEAVPVTVDDQGETSGIDCRMAPGGTISGSVYRESGEVLSGAILSAYNKEWELVSFAGSDYSGRYRLSGLDDGEHYLRATSHSLAGRYYPGTYRDSEAAAVAVSRENETGDIDFKLENGAAILGHVKRAEDVKPVAGATVTVFSSGWRPVETASCDGTGRYLIPALGPGDYHLCASRDGFIPQYYPGVEARDQAQILTVAAGQDTLSLDFSLKTSPGGIENSSDLDNSSAPHPVLASPHAESPRSSSLRDLSAARSPANGLPDSLILPSDAFARFADVEPGRAFHDPYRGVKIEVLEKEGAGAEARARLRVSLSEISLSPQKIDFPVVHVGSTATENLKLTNTGSRPLAVGEARLGGRNPDQFAILTDSCSGAVLGAGEICSVEVMFKPVARHLSLGEFAILTLPCDDPIRPLATVSLRGIAWGTDLVLRQRHFGDFRAGGSGTFEFEIANLGPETTTGEIAVTDTLADGLTLTGAGGSPDWSCSSEGQFVRCVATRQFSLHAVSKLSLQVLVGDKTPERFVNTAKLSYVEDTDPSNNTASEGVDVRVPARPKRPRPGLNPAR